MLRSKKTFQCDIVLEGFLYYPIKQWCHRLINWGRVRQHSNSFVPQLLQQLVELIGNRLGPWSRLADCTDYHQHKKNEFHINIIWSIDFIFLVGKGRDISSWFLMSFAMVGFLPWGRRIEFFGLGLDLSITEYTFDLIFFIENVCASPMK